MYKFLWLLTMLKKYFLSKKGLDFFIIFRRDFNS